MSDQKRPDLLFLITISVPSLLMALGVGNHLYQNQKMGLVRWKGGGFGMFTTVDSNTTRFTRFLVETRSGELFQIEEPAGFPSEFSYARSLPRGESPELLLERLIEQPCIWLVERVARRPAQELLTGEKAPARIRMLELGETIDTEADYVDVQALHLEIHTVAYDRDASELSTRMLRKLTIRKES